MVRNGAGGFRAHWVKAVNATSRTDGLLGGAFDPYQMYDDPTQSMKLDVFSLPADVSTVLYKMDFDASAKNKDRILAEWKKSIER